MMLINLGFTMAMAAIVNMLLIGAAHAVLNGDTIFRDGDTLFAQNAQREMIAHPIVDMTTEIDIPGTSTRVNITGTVEQVIAYINANFPDYVWPDDEEFNTNTAATKVATQDNQVFCDVFKQGSYYVARRVIKHLRHWKRHKINLVAGPAACTEVSCRIDAYKQTMAIWFCNDGESPASPTYQQIAYLAQIVLDKCVEFGTPFAWVRGQAFDTSLPWNAIVTRQDSCQKIIDSEAASRP